ncbi:MAG: hypothetical protein DMG97_28795, partial [Acidobacteria bacterium]
MWIKATPRAFQDNEPRAIAQNKNCMALAMQSSRTCEALLRNKSLERQVQSELLIAHWGRDVLDQSRRTTEDIIHRLREVHTIESVENLPPELEIDTLREMEVFVQAPIRRKEP